MLGEDVEGLSGYLLQKGKRLVSYGASLLFVLLKFLLYKGALQIEDSAEGQGVKLLHLIGGNQNIVCILIGNKDIVVAVVDNAPCRIAGHILVGIVLRIYLILLTEDLQIEQLNQKHNGNTCQTYYQDIFPIHSAAKRLPILQRAQRGHLPPYRQQSLSDTCQC